MVWTDAEILQHVEEVRDNVDVTMRALKEKQKQSGARERWGFEHIRRLQWFEPKRAPNRSSGKTLCVRVHDKDCRNPTCFTCHSCRQKIIDPQSTCSSCDDHWCGSCLISRMGEDPQEAFLNDKWVCPQCRRICNCSSASCQRNEPQWSSKLRTYVTLEKTGNLSGEAVRMGFRSHHEAQAWHRKDAWTAHYLMFTHFDPDVVAEPVRHDRSRSHTLRLASSATRPDRHAEGTNQLKLTRQQQQVAALEQEALRVMPDLQAIMGGAMHAPLPDLGINIFDTIAANISRPGNQPRRLASVSDRPLSTNGTVTPAPGSSHSVLRHSNNRNLGGSRSEAVISPADCAGQEAPGTPQLCLAGEQVSERSCEPAAPRTMRSILQSNSYSNTAHQSISRGTLMTTYRQQLLPDPAARVPIVNRDTPIGSASNDQGLMIEDENSRASVQGPFGSLLSDQGSDAPTAFGGHSGLGFRTLAAPFRRVNPTGLAHNARHHQQSHFQHSQHGPLIAPAFSKECIPIPFAAISTDRQQVPHNSGGTPGQDDHQPRARNVITFNAAHRGGILGERAGLHLNAEGASVQGEPVPLHPSRSVTPLGRVTPDPQGRDSSSRGGTPLADNSSPATAANDTGRASYLPLERTPGARPENPGKPQWYSPAAIQNDFAPSAAGLQPQLRALQRVWYELAKARAASNENFGESNDVVYLERAAAALVVRGLNTLERFNADRAVIHAASAIGAHPLHQAPLIIRQPGPIDIDGPAVAPAH